MAGGDGEDPFSQLVNDITSDPLGAFVDFTTRGLVSYDSKKGKLKKGATVRAVDETVGELTGRNMARKQAGLAAEAIRDEKAARLQDIANQREAKRQQDLAASQQAAGLRRKSVKKATQSSTSMTDSVTTDFLGL